MTSSRRKGGVLHILATMLKAELAAGILGLRLFIASVAVAAAMLGIVWMLGDGLATALQQNGRTMLGGDIAVTAANVPLEESRVAGLAQFGEVSRTVELRTSARAEGLRSPVELKAVDDAYPLFGSVGLEGADAVADALAVRDGRPGAVVEPALMARLDLVIGDTIRLGERLFDVRGQLMLEPDRLSAGTFLIGPRVIISRSELDATELVGPGALVEYRYRLRLPDGTDRDAADEQVRALEPPRGWELERPEDAGDRVRRTVDRTTSFLGIAALVALAIGLAGAWAAATVWVNRRARTIALYRMSGADVRMVVALHAIIIAIAGIVGLSFGLALAVAATLLLMDMVAAQLHLAWQATALLGPGIDVILTLVLGLTGASAAALSATARTPPGAAMQTGDAASTPDPRYAAAGAGAIALGLVLAVTSLPDLWLAVTAASGLALASSLLGLGGWWLARLASRGNPRSFLGLVARQGLAVPGAAASKALALGIGIAGITAIVSAQGSLESSLRGELPAKVPDLVLLDVQPDQVEPIRTRVENNPALSGLQASPFMRATILAVNGRPAGEALVRDDKSWVIDGDRSFSWTAEPTGAELLAGRWWDVDYEGPPLISPEEDVAEAFDLKPGDELTYSVLGRRFTSEVAGIRKEFHRTFRPEFLLVASPQPFRSAPHSWIMTLQGDAGPVIDELIRGLAETAPNVTSIDIRPVVARVVQVIDGTVLGSLAVAATLLLAGALSLAAVVAADVDSRRREALAFTLIGASRREIALARLAEAVVIGALAALLGGVAGIAGGAWLTEEALHVDWAPGALAFALPVVLGLIAALAAGAAGGLGPLPRGRGQLARYLST